MAQFQTGGVTTPASHSAREDLANFISNIVRDDTPFMSSIGKSKANALKHEWTTDKLRRPGANSHVEGSGFPTDPSATTDMVRLNNNTQIFSTALVVSGSIEAVNKAGRKSEFKYQSTKRGKEIMRDIEFTLIASRQGKDAVVANATARKMAGYHSWVPATNVVGGGTSTANVAAGTGAAAPTYTGSAGAFSLSKVDDVMQSVWQNGGKPTTLMMSPHFKREFSIQAQGQTTVTQATATSAVTSGSNVRRNIDEKGTLRQSVTMYESDFGLVKVVPNYIMAKSNTGTGAAASHADSDILVYDSSSFKLATLRPLHHRDISEDGDRLRAMMVTEMTLECRDPDAVGLIGNLSGA